MAPSSSPGQHDSIVPFVRQQHKRNLAADPLRIQLLEKRLDLLPFVQQLERKLTQPIKIPATPMPLLPGKSGKLSIFSIRTIFPYDNDDLRRETRSKLFNLKSLNLPNREWIKDLLLEESDSDDEGDVFSQRDIHAILKVHKMRRKVQRRYHTDPMNTQFTYLSSGALSTSDPFPEHQATVLRQHGAVTTTRGGKTDLPSASLPGPSSFNLLEPPLSVDPPESTAIPLPPLSR
ncbi:hypothetical protein WR25_23597 isoform A [Diploscapter pachys]|uniref:Uncharacterized protein n=2 Tax=Diploscapter pachys TaxID=2018661 RepID=A0A2A2L2X9_9BILA|nr:hypothetical protein WR25_23597 isoform A [Diploscapter pachys]